MKKQIIENYCFNQGKWFHLVRILNERGDRIAEVVTTNKNIKYKGSK